MYLLVKRVYQTTDESCTGLEGGFHSINNSIKSLRRLSEIRNTAENVFEFAGSFCVYVLYLKQAPFWFM